MAIQLILLLKVIILKEYRHYKDIEVKEVSSYLDLFKLFIVSFEKRDH